MRSDAPLPARTLTAFSILIPVVAGSSNDRDYYELFGEIANKTSLQTILIELRTLAENAIDAASDLRDSFKAAKQ